MLLQGILAPMKAARACAADMLKQNDLQCMADIEKASQHYAINVLSLKSFSLTLSLSSSCPLKPSLTHAVFSSVLTLGGFILRSTPSL